MLFTRQNGNNLFFDHPVQVSTVEKRVQRYKMVNVSDEGQVFECEICGNVVKVLEVGGGELICCGEPMVLQE